MGQIALAGRFEPAIDMLRIGVENFPIMVRFARGTREPLLSSEFPLKVTKLDMVQ